MGILANQYRRPLKHKRIEPIAICRFEQDDAVFQGWAVKRLADVTFPLRLERDEVILDLGDHYTGHLHVALEGCPDTLIPDSPVNIAFSFGEMPIELCETVTPSEKTLSLGWLQEDFKTVATFPYSGMLERRYSCRYLKLKRVDSIRFPILVTELFLDSTSAVDTDDCKPLVCEDNLLVQIDRACVKTLKECEQDVFEDGPKRDRRLWIGDLRLQALTDYETFGNLDLVKRCIYLFAEHLNDRGLVASYVYPDTKPYINQGGYHDYSLCFGLCLYDYWQHTDDLSLPSEWYDVAETQLRYTDRVFDRESGRIDASFFIDHGNYDRSTAALGYVAYVTRRMIALATILQKPTAFLEGLLNDVCGALRRRYDPASELFVAADGEISWQSQIWAALSGILSAEETSRLLETTVTTDPDIRISSPFMTHYYIEALIGCGKDKEALAHIKRYWGAILKAGFDCCPECFDERDERLSPYAHPVLNSACHAWSCTPSYWIRRYFS